MGERHRERFYTAIAEVLPALPSIREAIRIVADRGRGGAETIASIARSGVDVGLTLADSLERGHRPPPHDEVVIIRAAEESGTLCEKLRALSERLRTRREGRRRLLVSLAYPAFLFHFAALVGGIVAGGSSVFLTVAVIDGAAVGLTWFAVSDRVRKGGLARIWLGLPVIGKLSALDDTERVTAIAGDLYGAGRPLAAAVRSAADGARFDIHRRAVERAAERLADGESPEIVLGGIDFFDPDVREALALAAPVGRLENGLMAAAALARRRRESGSHALLRVVAIAAFAGGIGYAAWTILSFWGRLYSDL